MMAERLRSKSNGMLIARASKRVLRRPGVNKAALLRAPLHASAMPSELDFVDDSRERAALV